MKPGRLRRITVSSPYSVGPYADGVSEFDDTKVIIPEYHARSSTSAKQGAKPEEKIIDRFRVEPAEYRASATYVIRSEDEPARTSCISTSTPYSETNGATHFVEFAKEMAENDRKYEEIYFCQLLSLVNLYSMLHKGRFTQKMAKQNEDGEVDVEMPPDDLPERKPAKSANDCESGTVLTVPSLTTESPAKAEKSSVKSLGDGYRLLDGSAKPLTLEESAELYANPPPTPIGAAPKDKLTASAAVKIREHTTFPHFSNAAAARRGAALTA
ncbi:hypothetical protein OESDEN_02504 [Oesophagostomum dentatum]|uniref:Uncharacterized protein n=1 Tax=Oesophagostomum dentatum TaxID=61180 RepID=A0A0B1TN36_OESDE|nr:hypothetical protein OESDEN_02504 [Oesophagostomum dentatum]